MNRVGTESRYFLQVMEAARSICQRENEENDRKPWACASAPFMVYTRLNEAGSPCGKTLVQSGNLLPSSV
jgi:hypothetical protein